MVATAAALEVLRDLSGRKADGRGLRHTRVLMASWDAEEAGLRGARAWARKRKRSENPIPSYNLNMDCIYAVGDFFFLESDINGSVRLSRSLAERCRDILRKEGYEADIRPIAFLTGGTDAGELAKAGVDATTLMGMPWGNSDRASVYHTPQDTADTIEEEAVAAAIHLGITLAEEIDRGN